MNKRGEKGSILLENILAMLIMTIAGLALIGMVQRSMVVTFKAREQVNCTRLVQTGFARIKSLDFYYLFAADSSQADYGLQASYSYRSVLDGLRTSLNAARFDRFRIEIEFMRRDFSDADSDGSTADLIAFTDLNTDLEDDYDPNIRYFDQNGDADYYDTYTSGGRIVAEQPDTHIKKVTLDIFRNGRRACSQTEYVSLEQFTGEPNPSSESVLRLLVNAPANGGYIYSRDSAAQQNSRDLAISKAYPAEIAQYRADISIWLAINGETDPLATVRFYVGNSAELANTAADALGAFADSPLSVTGALVEGANVLRAQAVKDAYTSPIMQRTLLYDIVPPTASGETPTGTAATYTPFVGVDLADAGASTDAVSGICPDIITMQVNGQEVNAVFDAGTLVWIDSTTQTVPVLAAGTYNVAVEAGDYAGYKLAASWSFTVAVPVTDHSAPSTADPTPSGAAGSRLPVISLKVFDNQSGIIPSSIVMKVDGITVVDSSNIGQAYDAAEDLVSYTPPAEYAAGSAHTVEVQASHWATDPADKVTDTRSWGFFVP